MQRDAEYKVTDKGGKYAAKVTVDDLASKTSGRKLASLGPSLELLPTAHKQQSGYSCPGT